MKCLSEEKSHITKGSLFKKTSKEKNKRQRKNEAKKEAKENKKKQKRVPLFPLSEFYLVSHLIYLFGNRTYVYYLHIIMT